MTAIRLAYLLKKFPRLSETFVLNEIIQQERLGADIVVLSRRPPDPEPRHPQFRDLRARVEILDPAQGLEPFLELFGTGPEHERRLALFAALVREFSRYAHPRLPALCSEALQVQRRARELEIDHIHAHFATDSALVAMLVRELGGPTYSVTAHAKDIYRSTVDPELLSRIVARSTFTVTVCDANVAHLDSILTREAMSRVRRLYNGVDLTAFAPSAIERAADEVLGVGRLVEKKGFGIFVEAMGLLRDRGLRCRATIVGEGEDRAAIEGLISRLDLGDRIVLTGALDQAAVRERMARASVLCMPCIVGDDGNRDALPTALLEALASGLPCVSTPVTGIPEILDGGAAGVLVPENDSRATADALEKLLRDPAERHRLSLAGRRRAEQFFDAEAVARVLHGWFEAACEGVAPAPA